MLFRPPIRDANIPVPGQPKQEEEEEPSPEEVVKLTLTKLETAKKEVNEALDAMGKAAVVQTSGGHYGGSSRPSGLGYPGHMGQNVLSPAQTGALLEVAKVSQESLVLKTLAVDDEVEVERFEAALKLTLTLTLIGGGTLSSNLTLTLTLIGGGTL